jgi:hypothetical protein
LEDGSAAVVQRNLGSILEQDEGALSAANAETAQEVRGLAYVGICVSQPFRFSLRDGEPFLTLQ